MVSGVEYVQLSRHWLATLCPMTSNARCSELLQQLSQVAEMLDRVRVVVVRKDVVAELRAVSRLLEVHQSQSPVELMGPWTQRYVKLLEELLADPLMYLWMPRPPTAVESAVEALVLGVRVLQVLPTMSAVVCILPAPEGFVEVMGGTVIRGPLEALT